MTAQAFLAARDFLQRHRTDYDTACRDFRWPQLGAFNWALDYFDAIARGNDKPALWIVGAEGGAGTQYSFAQMSERSARVANYLRGAGVGRGDRILLMLPNRVELWDAMLAAMKLGAVVLPATTQLSAGTCATACSSAARASPSSTRTGRQVRRPELPLTRFVAGAPPAGTPSATATPRPPTSCRTAPPTPTTRCCSTSPRAPPPSPSWSSTPTGPTGRQPVDHVLGRPATRRRALEHQLAGLGQHAQELLLRATERPGLRVRLQLRPLRAAGGARHAGALRRHHPVRSAHGVAHAGAAAAGRLPHRAARDRRRRRAAQPEIIERVRHAWGITIRDGYGQTETTCMIGNPPGQPVVPGSMGRPLPGYRIALLDPDGKPAEEGEIALPLDGGATRPAGLMRGYANNRTPPRTPCATATTALLRHRAAARGRLLRLRRPRRRRLQVFRLPPEPVLSWKRDDRARRHRRGGGGAQPRPGAPVGAQGLCLAAPGHVASAELAREIFRSRASGWRRTSASAGCSSPSCPRPSPARSAAWSCGAEMARGDEAAQRMPGEYWEEDFADLKP